MLNNNPTQKPEWAALLEHQKTWGSIHIQKLFQGDPKRAENFHLTLEGLYFDYSKHRMTQETIDLLCQLATACDIAGQRDHMFSGTKINTSEGRAALHTALRRPITDTVEVDGENIMPLVEQSLHQIKTFSSAVRDGVITGHTGQSFKHIVNIGIGGSDLGPHMACQALEPYGDPNIEMHFVSNIDGDDIASTLKTIDPETTLFLIASKTFTTLETMTNAETAKKWLVEKLGPDAVAKHFAAISTNKDSVQKFGIAENRMFPFEDWVGGRYSLWSSIGMPIAIYIGYDNFRALLDGAYTMDRHFQDAPLDKNMPVIMGMLGVWYRNFWNMSSHAVIPYSERLARFPAYLQQLDMESNGKSVDRNGDPITDYQTGPNVFGEVGSNSEHSFFQKLLEGTDITPIDFIAAINPGHSLADHNKTLLEKMVAQGEAFLERNRPSSTLLVDKLDPYNLGMLIALYEHKVFVQGIIWNINSFHQPGVELGKQRARDIASGNTENMSPSGKGSLAHIQARLQ